jgi:hypothetical protein
VGRLGNWPWLDAILDSYPRDRFAIVSATGELLALLASKKKRLLNHPCGPLYRLDFVEVAPRRIGSVRRQAIGEALVRTFPMVVLVFPDQLEQPDADFVTGWVESSVPVPVNEKQPLSPVLAVPPWLSLSPFMSVPAGVDFIVSTFAADASIPTGPVSAPTFNVDPAERSTFGAVPVMVPPAR